MVPVILTMFILSGCSSSDRILEINDKMFLSQVSDIYTNYKDYDGKKVKIEGIYNYFEYDEETNHIVYRNGPGCCGDDGLVGLFFNYDGEHPLYNDWIEVVGTLEIGQVNGLEDIIINVESLTVNDERGLETVSQ